MTQITLPLTLPLAPFSPSRSHAEADISVRLGLGQLWGNASLVSLALIPHVLNTKWHETAQLQNWSWNPLAPLSVWLPCFQPVLIVTQWPPGAHSWVQSIHPVASDTTDVSKVLSCRLKRSVAVISSNRRVATDFDDLISNFGRVVSCCVYLGKFLKLFRFNFLMYKLNWLSFTCLVKIRENHVLLELF